MDRLIKANALKERIREVYTVADDEESGMEQIVDEQPTVDAVEVVRCKNCRFLHAVLVSSPHLYYCRYNHKTVDEMDYCSKGENK
jgi:hypothetical protein